MFIVSVVRVAMIPYLMTNNYTDGIEHPSNDHFVHGLRHAVIALSVSVRECLEKMKGHAAFPSSVIQHHNTMYPSMAMKCELLAKDGGWVPCNAILQRLLQISLYQSLKQLIPCALE